MRRELYRGSHTSGFPGGSDDKQSACNVGDLGLTPGLGRSPWRREWLPTPVFWPGESHGKKSLAGYSPLGHKELDMTERITVTFLYITSCLELTANYEGAATVIFILHMWNSVLER